MNEQEPQQRRTQSAAIQRNADKLMAIIDSERNAAIAAIAPRLVDIEQRLGLLQDRLLYTHTTPSADAKELAGLQGLFIDFRNSSGVLAANAARVSELEASLTQLQTTNRTLLQRASAAVTMAREKEGQAKNTLDAVRDQLNLIGMAINDDGKLGFGPEWNDILEKLGLVSQAPGQTNIISILSSLATKMRNEREVGNSTTEPLINDRHPNGSGEIIDLADDGPTAGPSKCPQHK